jgi:DNA-directed RNA polymerase delta subunit
MSSNVETIEEQIRIVKAYLPLDDSFNNTAAKRLQKLEVALDFAKEGGDRVVVLRDEVIIDGVFIATLLNKKWKVKGKRKWYRYDSPKNLLHKLIIKLGESL